MSNYKHIFFDLDRTLWDFDKNSSETLKEIFIELKLHDYFSSVAQFLEIYYKHNDKLWEGYRLGKLSKEDLRSLRFDLTLRDVNVINPELADIIGKYYVRIIADKTYLQPFAFEILNYLQPKYYLYILTNGFRDTQLDKLEKTGLSLFFSRVFTSETIGFNKPHPEIFHRAVSSVNAKKNECLMIGDDFEVDIMGAKSYGIDQVFFNPGNLFINEKATYEINSLINLKSIL